MAGTSSLAPQSSTAQATAAETMSVTAAKTISHHSDFLIMPVMTTPQPNLDNQPSPATAAKFMSHHSDFVLLHMPVVTTP